MKWYHQSAICTPCLDWTLNSQSETPNHKHCIPTCHPKQHLHTWHTSHRHMCRGLQAACRKQAKEIHRCSPGRPIAHTQQRHQLQATPHRTCTRTMDIHQRPSHTDYAPQTTDHSMAHDLPIECITLSQQSRATIPPESRIRITQAAAAWIIPAQAATLEPAFHYRAATGGMHASSSEQSWMSNKNSHTPGSSEVKPSKQQRSKHARACTHQPQLQGGLWPQGAPHPCTIWQQATFSTATAKQQ